MSPANDKFTRLLAKFAPDSVLLGASALTGGVSAQVTALEIERAEGKRQKLIVRQHGEVDRQRNPQIAVDEFRLLDMLQQAGIAAPKPYYVDASGAIFGKPVIVIEYIDGETEFAPADLVDFIVQFAEHLSGIHSVDRLAFDVSFLPRADQIAAAKLRQRPARVDDSIDEGRIRSVLESVVPFPQRNGSTLLHGDYWLGNLLWKNGQLVGVIDWEDAAFGDPLADVGNSRLELLWALGSAAMQRFTDQYQAITGVDLMSLPYWDLYAALRPAFKISAWAGGATAEKTMRERHRAFITQAFEKLENR